MDEHISIDLLTRIAWLYYYEDLSHQEIGEQLGLPRIKVTRLLKVIRERRLVEVRLKESCWSVYEVERKFKEKTGLSKALVVPTGKDPIVNVAHAAALQLQDLCLRHERIGIGAGRALERAVEYFEQVPDKKVKEIVSLLGNTMPNLALNPYAIGLVLSNKLKVDFFNIWAPAVATSVDTARILKKDYVISKVLEMANSVEIGILGIGDIKSSVMMTRGFISSEEAEDIADRGAVGEILGRFFDVEGRRVPTILEDRVIAVEMPMKCPMMAVAYGKEKILSIVGAIRGGFIQGLVTDERTALAVLRFLSSKGGQ